MLDENLMRAELSPAERAKATARRKAVYLKLHPETAAGASQAAGMNNAQGRGDVGAKSAPTFSQETSAATGRAKRTVQLDTERGEKVTGRRPGQGGWHPARQRGVPRPAEGRAGGS